MAISLFIAVLILTAASVIVASRIAANDGGPSRRPPERPEDAWSPELPTHPYAD